MKKFIGTGTFVSTLLALTLSTGAAGLLSLACANAASTDIVAPDSTIRDSLAELASDGALPTNAGLLLEEPVLTRGDAALLLEQGLSLGGSTAPTLKKSNEAAAVRNLLIELRPELLADHVNVDAVLKGLPSSSASLLIALMPEARIDTGGKGNSGSSVDGIYRGTVVGNAGEHTQYGISVTDQAKDDRRVFDNDIGPNDYSALTQAYVKFNGSKGLSFLIGRTDDNWGSAAEGGALLSDNAPPLDQLRVSFPFSLGSHLGRNWDYIQLASTYSEDNQRKYLQARRIEINFSSHWSAQYEEALKSTSSSLLYRAPLPFLIAKSIDLAGVEAESEFVGNLGLNYSANKEFRTFGQLLINDIKSPFTGHFLGFDVGNGGYTPQRLAYVAGAAYESHHGTTANVEYSTADDTTYLDSNAALAWTKGTYDYLGLPDGPNFKQIYGILSQTVAPKLTLSAEGRNRSLYSDSYPNLKSQDVALSASYQLDRRNSVSLTYHDYYQNAYSIAPGTADYPTGDGYISPSQSNPGSSLTIHELDAGYELVY
jgi:hypothetical protein